ncbi:hypothetical protein C9374_003634 [Naegleria lovaniensis]|uniref:Uncharacterized protein n=1 Tax=Naegleria lovaniensis TaxID=51637 RepID=A0AA88H3B6_NAELO|nr:uncharacterized protein C9374_003634 [Naegleria lovaniensis]KAG2393870.1 hypothetical protein C9374_003634 [Naegleria lovaniensis]
MWAQQSPTSPTHQQHEFIISTNDNITSNLNSNDGTLNNDGIVDTSYHYNMRSNTGNNNSSSRPIHNSLYAGAARHVFLHSHDYSLFRKTERLVWQLNHLHANVKQLIQKSEHSMNSSHVPSPSSPSLSTRNIQVIASSVKHQKELSMRKNRFLRNNIHLLDMPSSHFHHHTHPSFDESVVGFTSSSIISSINTPEYTNERINSSIQNSPSMSEDSLISQYHHGITHPFPGELSLPRSMSIDQLNQATNNGIVRSISIDQIHYNGSNNNQGGVVILPSHLYGDQGGIFSSSPKGVHHTLHESFNSLEISSIASNEELFGSEEHNMELLPSTLVHTIYSKYGLVLTIDVSPSMLAMDPTTGEVLFDRVFVAISNVITHLIQPLTIPNYNGEIIPEIHVTCVAIGMAGRPVFSLFQDCHITTYNLNEMLGKIYQQLCDLENLASTSLKNSKANDNLATNLKFSQYVKDSLLALEFLPPDACPILMLVSDSVFNLSDLNSDIVFDINQRDVSIAILNITSQSNGHGHLYSYVPDSELIESLVACTDGVYIDFDYMSNSENEMNEKKKTKALQYGLLLKSPSILIADNESLILSASEGSIFPSIPSDSIKKDIRKNFFEYDVLTYNLTMSSVDPILKKRAIQGFRITDIKYTNPTDKLSKFKAEDEKLDLKYVKMSLLYRRNLEIIYKVHVERFGPGMEDQDLDVLSSNSFSGFGISKANKAKISVTISVFMHKNNLEKFKAFLKKRTKEPFLKHLQEYIQSINIEDVLVEQYFNLSENCSGLNRSSIRKMDIPNINFDHERECFFETQKLALCFNSDENIQKSDVTIQKILSQIQTGTSDASPTVQNNLTLFKSFCENGWCSTKISDDIFILFISEQDHTCYMYDTVHDTTLLTMEEKDTSVSCGFCLLKIAKSYTSVVELKFQFFNVSSFTIFRVLRHFKEQALKLFYQRNIHAHFIENSAFSEIVARLPICKDDESQYQQSLFSHSPHFTSYLKHRNWIWPIGGRLNIAAILSCLLAQRVNEGFSLVITRQSVVFFKELEITKTNYFSNSDFLSKLILFYCIHILKKEKKLVTEVWVEPQSGYVTYSNGVHVDSNQFCTDLCDNWFHNLDLQVISLFSTFENIVTACKSGKGNNSITVFQPDKPGSITPFNLKGVFERSEHQNLKFSVFKFITHTDTDVETAKKSNIALYDRLLKILCNINDVEISLDRIPLNLDMKARCFARVFENIGSDKQKDFLLTIVPSHVTGEEKDFTIIVCVCTEDQLLFVDKLKRNENMERVVCSKHSPSILRNPALAHDEEHALASSATYCDFVTNLHAYSFTYGVYKYLNQKLMIDRESIVSAVESCYEYREEIDLTEFFEAILLSRNYFFDKSENDTTPCENMVNSFKTIIEKYFEEIKGTKFHFYLRESSIPKSTKTVPKPIKKKNSVKSFDHLEEIDNEENYDEDVSDDEIHSFHSGEDETTHSLSSLSAGMRDVQTSDHQSDSLTESSGSSVSDAFNLTELENSTIPVFMRMECVLTPIKRGKEEWEDLDDLDEYANDLKLPIKNIPIERISKSIRSSNGDFSKLSSSFGEKEEDSEEDDESDFTPSKLKTEMDFDWINSLNTVKTTLRFYCITLPPDKYCASFNGFEPSKKDVLGMFRSHVSETQSAYARSKFELEDDVFDGDTTDEAAPYLDKGYLPRHIRRIVSRTKKRLQALVSKEILNALLRTHPITSYSIKKVFDNVEKLPASCYQKHTIPLFFIDPVEGAKLFHQELLKCKNVVFKSIDNHYVVYFRKRNCCQKHAIFEEYDRKCEHELPPGDTPNKFKIFSKELDDLDMTMFDNDTEMERSCIEVPFWIILKAESKKSMSMLFYSPNSLSISQANDVVNIVFKAVGVVCKRVNTLLLLSNLHDTRICSSLLLPVRRDKDKKAVSEVSVLDKKFLRKDNEKPSSDKFNEGDFACKKTFEISFPLHSRLSTAMAINHLNQVVFNPFVVANRSEMFVYKERSGRVFYLQLTDGNKQNSTTVQTPKSEESPTLVSSARDEQEHKTKLKEYSISLSSMGQYLYAEFDIKNDISSVILEVYGVYPPSIEITTQLKNLIEAKLSSLTMNIISNLLLRNRQFKITVEDLQFIRPLLSQPHKSVVITLPKFINNKLLFMLFARNNMLTYMNQLYLTSSDESAESPSTISYMSFTEDEEDDMVFKAADFSFLYNSVTQNTYSRAMTSQVNCRGIACVQMTLLNQDGEMVTVFPSMKEPYTCDLTGVSQLGLLQEEPSNIAYTDFGAPILRKEGSNSDDEDDEENVIEKSASAAHRSENGKILLEVWKKGDIDLASLIEKLCLTLNQTLIDYIIECGLFTSPVNLEGLNRYFLVRLQTQAIKACRISSPTLMEHRASLFLPLWEMNRFIGDLYNLLSAYSFKLRPITFVSKDTRQTFVKYSRSNDFIEQYHLVDSSNICFVMMAGNFSVLTDKVINIGENIKIGDIISLDGFSYRNSIKYTRKCCIVIILTSSELQVIAYNWKPQQFEKFKYHLHQTVSWLRCRAHLLNSILHQKLGLFYHSHSTNLATVPTNLLIPLGKPQKEVQFAFNNIDLLIYNKQSAPSDPKSSNTMRRTNPAVTTSTTTNNPTGSMIPPKQPILDVRGGQMYNRFKNPGMNSTLVTSSVNDISVKTDIQKVRKEKKPPSSKNQFGSLLKGIFDLDKTPCKQLAKKTMNDNKPRDPLLIHGLHFKHIVHQNYKKKVEQQQVSKIYGFWNKSQSTNLKSKDFQLIKNTSRLIHFCRVPLLFNPLRRILFSPSSFISSSSAAIIQHLDSEGVTGVEEQQNNNLREIGYHRKVFESFLSEYVEYIKSLDISDVFLHPSDQHDSSPLLASTPSDMNPITTSTDNKSRPQPTPLVQVVGNQIIKLQPTTIYFHKQMDDGVLFLELGLDSIYVYLNVYISDITSQRPSLLNPRASTRGEFLKKVSQFKHSLHMNSFSYDFHLRNFLNYLTTDYSGFPSTLSFMSLLKDFNQFYPNPPPHTRNILHSHTITFENVKDIAEIMREKATTPKSSMKSLERGRSYSTERREMLNDPFQFFFEYICKHSDKYKVKFSQKSKECFILDTYISHEEADYSYCVLVTKSVVHSDSHTTFSYHGASSTNSSRSPSPQEEDSTMNLTMYIVFVDATNRHPYDSEIEGSKDNMYKVITQMAQQYERKLANLLQSVKNSFKLDILWDMALKFRMSENLFNELDALWTKTQITEYDFTLSIFEATYVPWNDVISELWNIYGGERAGSIFKKDGTAQHLLITPSNRSTDFMLHIHYKIKENSVIIYFCKKKLANEPESLQDQTHSASMLRSPNTNMPSPAVRVDQKSEGAQSLIIIPNQTERDFIGSFVNHVCYVLYRLSF